MSKDLLNIQQVAAKVNLTQGWIYERIKNGKFPTGEKFGHARLWTEAEIDKWLEAKKEEKA